MTLPHNALVLVADGRKMLFLRNHGDAALLDLRVEDHDQRQDSKDSDMKTDAPGRSFQSFSPGRSAIEEPDYKQQEEDRFAAQAADLLKDRALANDFDALAIVAAPKTLGVLRAKLHKEVQRRIIAQHPKEMTDRPIPDIEALFRGDASPPG